MRIVAGTARGRPIEGPCKKEGIRPTADRVRETLFNILGQFLQGERVLDLYAGTGALALEALSRGAAAAVLVDQDREAAQLCRKNADALGFGAQVDVLLSPCARAVEKLARGTQHFELVFADPPYAANALADILRWVSEGKLLTPEGTLVIEHDKREEAPETTSHWTRTDQRSFGDTRVSFFQSVRS